jgi:hypothetical protein
MGRQNILDGVGSCIPHTFAKPHLTVNEQVYELYLRVFYSKKIREQKELKATLLATKSELMQTSSQDQFAKWAKLKRKIDKGFTDLETLSE